MLNLAPPAGVQADRSPAPAGGQGELCYFNYIAIDRIQNRIEYIDSHAHIHRPVESSFIAVIRARKSAVAFPDPKVQVKNVPQSL